MNVAGAETEEDDEDDDEIAVVDVAVVEPLVEVVGDETAVEDVDAVVDGTEDDDEDDWVEDTP